jgi:hypothetical protein
VQGPDEEKPGETKLFRAGVQVRIEIVDDVMVGAVERIFRRELE